MSESIMKVMVCADVATHNVKDTVDKKFCERLLRDMKPVLDTADFRLANLECVLCTADVGYDIVKSGPNLRGEPEHISFLNEAGIDCAILANNHFGDRGEDGCVATINLVKENKIAYVGGGRNITEAYKAWYAVKNGIRVAFIAVCENEFGVATDTQYGSAGFSMKRLRDRIVEEKKLSDFVVVLFHGGNEHNPLPSPETMDRYRLIIDMGADALVGGHTHCMQGFEMYNGCPIIYSMGNYFFMKGNLSGNAAAWNHGYMTELTFTHGEPVSFTVIPYVLCDEGRWLHVLDGERKEKILAYLDKLSAIIQEPAEIQRYFDAWCTQAGVGYSTHINHNVAYLDDSPSIEDAKRQAGLRNIFWCEAHDALMRGLTRIELENRFERAHADLPELLALAEIPV